MEYNLLEKTELRFENIRLTGVNLNDVAAAVADVLKIHRKDVLVIDAINTTLTIDLLCRTIDPHALVGRKQVLFDQLKRIPNVGITDTTTIHSQGILGWIAMDETQGRTALRVSEKMAADIERALAKRVLVFSTGIEVVTGQIEDTNQPALSYALTAEGYAVTRGPALCDDADYIAGMIRKAVAQEGYGVVITTGGVGAETKDQSVEALERLDPDAATPYICTFEQGRGRHVKEGIRIGVAEFLGATIVALPGPNDEVRASLPIVIDCLKQKSDKHVMAERLARHLRDILRNKMGNHHFNHV